MEEEWWERIPIFIFKEKIFFIGHEEVHLLDELLLKKVIFQLDNSA